MRYSRLLHNYYKNYIFFIDNAFLLAHPKVAIHKLCLTSSLGINLGWCKVLKMLFGIFVTLCNISELNSQFSAAFSSTGIHRSLAVSVHLKEESELSVTNLLIYMEDCGVCLFFCFHGSRQKQLDFWASGSFWGNLQSFGQTGNFCALGFCFLECFFVVVIENNVHGKCTSMSPCCVWFQTGQMWE